MNTTLKDLAKSLTYPLDEEIELSEDRVEHYRECIESYKRSIRSDREALRDEKCYLSQLRKLRK